MLYKECETNTLLNSIINLVSLNWTNFKIKQNFKQCYLQIFKNFLETYKN